MQTNKDTKHESEVTVQREYYTKNPLDLSEKCRHLITLSTSHFIIHMNYTESFRNQQFQVKSEFQFPLFSWNPITYTDK